MKDIPFSDRKIFPLSESASGHYGMQRRNNLKIQLDVLCQSIGIIFA